MMVNGRASQSSPEDVPMNDWPRFGVVDLICVLLLVGVAAGVRAAYVFDFAAEGQGMPPFEVQGQGIARPVPGTNGETRTEQQELIQNLREQRWFGCLAPLADHEEETANVAPGYPWLVSLASRVTDAPDALVRWVQCALGALTVLCYYLFAHRAFASTLAASLAGLLVALHPFWIINTAELADGVLVGFLLSAALALGTRGSQVGGAFTSLLYGLSLSALAMVRAALLPFAVIAFVWYLARCRTLRAGWFAALLALLGFANGLAPWVVRNGRVFQEPLPIADSAYLHLWMGNNPKANGKTLSETALRESLRPELCAQLVADENQPRRYGRLGREVLDYVQRDPAAALGHRLDAGISFTLGGSWIDGHRLTLRRTGNEVPDVADWIAELVETSLRGSLLLMILLGALGWRLSAAWGPRARLAALAVIWVSLPYLLSHAEALAGPRLPLDGVLLCYVAFAIACMVPGFARTPEEAAAAQARALEAST
jgi:4-amino-4-deoxy-L-arabinose transferase-like glycosyltransferase